MRPSVPPPEAATAAGWRRPRRQGRPRVTGTKSADGTPGPSRQQHRHGCFRL